MTSGTASLTVADPMTSAFWLQDDRTFVYAVASDGLPGDGWTTPQSVRFATVKYVRMAQAAVYPLFKRSLDVLVAATLLVVLSPVFLVLAAVIKATDGGPVLYCQKRVGRWGREFRFPKFRSMVPGADGKLAALLAANLHKTGVTFKIANDPRLTRVGRFIRRTSLDELPQLWCVLTGTMTLVGPRPAVPREVAQYTLADRRRLEVTPGLTCFWQVRGRSNIPFDRQVEMDLEYIDQRSVLLDLRLLALTVPAVLSGRGAY